MLVLLKWVIFLLFLISTECNKNCINGRNVIFDCTFMTHDFKALELDNCYACEVQNQVYSFDECKILSNVNGAHLDYKNDNDVMCLRVINASLHSFPAQIENFFENLKMITINKSGLKEIHKKSLKPFKELRSLDLSANKLEYIDEDLFSSNINLISLNLSDNNLNYIEKDLFKLNAKLQNLDLSKNKLNIIEKGMFSSNEKLRFLDLGKNKLELIDRDLFKFNKNLEIINLEDNKFAVNDFNWNAFKNINHLKFLNIFNKSLTLETINFIPGTCKVTREDQNLSHVNDSTTSTTTTESIEQPDNREICQNSTKDETTTDHENVQKQCKCQEVDYSVNIIICLSILAILQFIFIIIQWCKYKLRTVEIDDVYEYPRDVVKRRKVEVEDDYAEVGLNTDDFQFEELPNNSLGDEVYEEIPGDKLNQKTWRENSTDYQEVGIDYQTVPDEVNYVIESGYEELPGVGGQNEATSTAGVEVYPDYAEVSFNLTNDDEIPPVLPVYATIDRSKKIVKS